MLMYCNASLALYTPGIHYTNSKPMCPVSLYPAEADKLVLPYNRKITQIT